jgi:2-methylaconitate cis-trans-isomerase PrpF
MGLAVDEKSAHLVRGTPKIAMLSPPKSTNIFTTETKTTTDIHVNSYSMGKPHPSFQLTGAVCLGAATSIHGTVAFDIKERVKLLTPPGTPPPEVAKDGVDIGSATLGRKVTVEHASGEIEAEVNLTEGMDGEVKVEGVAVSRTARRLFEGNVLLRM